MRKPIIILTQQYELQESDIPPNWIKFKKLLMGPRVIKYAPKFIAQCAEKLISVRKDMKNMNSFFYSPTDIGNVNSNLVTQK
jgi:hypothetical protein